MARRRTPGSIFRYDFGKYVFFIALSTVLIALMVLDGIQEAPSPLPPPPTPIATYRVVTVGALPIVLGPGQSAAASPTGAQETVAPVAVAPATSAPIDSTVAAAINTSATDTPTPEPAATSTPTPEPTATDTPDT